MDYDAKPVDVLCVGNASYDFVFQVNHHPGGDEKMTARAFLQCSGGPAANAAVTVARLGAVSAFIGYIGTDEYGEKQRFDLRHENVNTEYIAVGEAPLPVSTILVKPDGSRSVVNYRGEVDYLSADFVTDTNLLPRVLLFDGHEPYVADELMANFKAIKIPSILDAGSVHLGTRHLVDKVNYIIASEKFALEFTGKEGMDAVRDLAQRAPNVIVTRGAKSILWKNPENEGEFPAFSVKAVDTTGAGDVFHGAYAYALANRMGWQERLRFSAAAAALSCTKLGGRTSIPTGKELQQFLDSLR